MFYLFLLVILMIVLCDINFLKAYDREAFKEGFVFSKKNIFFAIIFFLLIFWFFESKEVLVRKIFPWSIFLSWYLLRRSKINNMLEEKNDIFSERYLNYRMISDSFGLICLWFLLVLAFSFFIHRCVFLFPAFDSELGELVLIGFFSSGFLLCLIAYASNKISSNGFLYEMAVYKPSKSFIKVFFLPAIAGLIFASFSSVIVLNRSVQPETPLSGILDSATSGVSIFLFIFLAIIVAPFVEEITFRGYFYKILKKAKGKVFAFIFVSFVFAGMHYAQYWGDWLAILIVTILGFVLTFFRMWTKTTVASIVMHYFYNGGMVVLPIVFLVFSNPFYFKYIAFYETYNFETKEFLLIKAIEKNPRLSEALHDLAGLYVDNDLKFLDALRLIDQAIELNTKEPQFWDTKIKILYKLKRDSDAFEMKKKLLKKYPKWVLPEYSCNENK